MMRYSTGFYAGISVKHGLILAIVDIILFILIIYFIIYICKQVSKFIYIVLWL